jgi:hypothetical protein
MEHVIKNQLLSYLLIKSLISKHQHAFIVKHSTTTNLLECLQDWSVALNDGCSVDVIYIDFKRAFDCIVYSKLLYKLQRYGICGKLLAWISAFLHARTQSVVIENCHSDYVDVISGVPQGSILGPILFILFINDIDLACPTNTNLKLFADDLKLYSVISLDSTSASINLQQSVDKVSEWASLWQFSINVSKTTVHTLSNYSTSLRSYSVNSVALSHSDPVPDLGISIDRQLLFKVHINNIVSKAFQRSGILFRGFICRNLTLMRKAFITYIRPTLEYGSCTWNPSYKYLIDQIESVQRRFTKRIPCISSMSYLERLAAIKLDTLELRRLRIDLINYYKILNNLTPLNCNQYFKFHTPPFSSRTTQPSLQKPIKGSVKLFSSFFYRAIDCWNYLPPPVRTAQSLSKFKSLLSNTDLSMFLHGDAFTVN